MLFVPLWLALAFAFPFWLLLFALALALVAICRAILESESTGCELAFVMVGMPLRSCVTGGGCRG